MKTTFSLQSILACIGAGSLLVYVLACATSFSPDDRQVLYPAFDTQGGATAVALYDRKSGRSETLMTATLGQCATNRESILIRAEWMPDGKHILVGQLVEDHTLLLTILPRGVKDPVRNFAIPGFEDAVFTLEFPFVVAGSRLILNGEKSAPRRLDLLTGEIIGGNTNDNSLVVMPSPDGKTLAGLRSVKSGKFTEYGLFDPETMQFKPAGTLPDEVADGSIPCFNPADGRVAVASKGEDQLKFQIFKDGKVELTRLLSLPGGNLEVGPFLDFAPDGKTVFAAGCIVTESKTNSEYGLLEIPLNDAPLRFTPLFHADHSGDGDLIFAQPSLSHDGKTWAIATSYLYRQNQSLRAEDCALFLVDVSKAKRPVTKVPVPVPPQREKLLL
jgi:hypothetical protein